MHVLDIETAAGERFKVSLRRFVNAHRFSAPEHVALEYRILHLLQEAGVAAPRPLHLDREGQLFGMPAIVLSYLAGRPVVSPRNERRWLDGLASLLHTVHDVRPDRYDLAFLPRELKDEIGASFAERREGANKAASADRPLALEVVDALESGLAEISWLSPCLVHRDFHPGNVIWQRNRVMGVVDWTGALLGDPRIDISQCRADLVVSRGIEAADAFLSVYRSSASVPLTDIWYFDLYRGLSAFLYRDYYIRGYRDLRLELESNGVRARLEAFLHCALQEQASH
jgi:aminoglycoside phosphotransferase (APT) family kinase protein